MIEVPADLDLSVPSFRGAYHFARRAAYEAAAAAGREHPNTDDNKAGNAVFSRLLWHVEASEGGFIGLHDDAFFEKCERDPRIDPAIAQDAIWNPGKWPTTNTIERTAA